VNLPEEVEGNPDPSQLLTLLDNVGGFSETDREGLSKYIYNVQHRVSFIGTPRADSPALLEDFYRTIETNLKHIVFSLLQKHDPILTTRTLKELVSASELCGGRYYTVAQQQAQRVCLCLQATPLLNLQRSLAGFRAMCLDGIVGDIYKDDRHSVHAYTTALRDLGRTLGIPGSTDPKPFNDVYSPQNFDAHDILERFRRSYTPQSIIYDWILPKLNDDEDFRNDYIDLQEEQVPESWIVPDATKPPTKEEKEHDFLGRVVYDESGKLQPSAIRFLLERLGVLRCAIP
jgi:hypothetical protein